MNEQMNPSLVLWGRWDEYYLYFPYFAMIKTGAWWCYVACPGSRGWCVGELRIDIHSAGLGPVSLPSPEVPFREWRELRYAIKRKIRKTCCCLQGDCSGLRWESPVNILDLKESPFFLFYSPPPLSLPALSPSSWGSLPLNHMRRAQGPLGPRGRTPVGNELHDLVTVCCKRQAPGGYHVFWHITTLLTLPSPPSPASQTLALL